VDFRCTALAEGILASLPRVRLEFYPKSARQSVAVKMLWPSLTAESSDDILPVTRTTHPFAIGNNIWTFTFRLSFSGKFPVVPGVMSIHFAASLPAVWRIQLQISTSSSLFQLEMTDARLFVVGCQPVLNTCQAFLLGYKIANAKTAVRQRSCSC
jgi:hypothetical protein